jgi:hypothetical protein
MNEMWCFELMNYKKDLANKRSHDIQHNDTQHNDNQHNGLNCDIQDNDTA